MNGPRLARFDTVRAGIFAQHDELQRLLGLSGALVGAAARGDERCRQELPRAFDTVSGKLLGHLDFEEQTLFPLLERRMGDVSPLVHRREEHARQRQELTKLGQLAWKADDLAALTAAFDEFVRDLRADMAAEERWLLAEDAGQASQADQADQADQEGEPHVDHR